MNQNAWEVTIDNALQSGTYATREQAEQAALAARNSNPGKTVAIRESAQGNPSGQPGAPGNQGSGTAAGNQTPGAPVGIPVNK
jgi:hypothetical protein